MEEIKITKEDIEEMLDNLEMEGFVNWPMETGELSQMLFLWMKDRKENTEVIKP